MSDELCSCGESLATCPHLGMFNSYAEKALFFGAKPERLAAMKRLDEIGKLCGDLRDRLLLANAAHDATKVASDFGVEVPYKKDIVQIADSVASFGHMIGYIPFVANNPTAHTALDVFVQAAKLLLRALKGD